MSCNGKQQLYFPQNRKLHATASLKHSVPYLNPVFSIKKIPKTPRIPPAAISSISGNLVFHTMIVTVAAHNKVCSYPDCLEVEDIP